MLVFARNKGPDGLLTVINRGDYDYTYALPHDWQGARGLVGMMPWDGALRLPPLSCALLGRGNWVQEL